MFIGHFGVAMAAKHVAPAPSLGTLVMAAMWVDLMWPLFLFLGLESVDIVPGVTRVVPLDFVSYPYTHSLLAGALWAALLGGVYYALRKDRVGAAWLGALVLSHWVLDFVAHRPDLPLWPGGTARFGLGMWNSMPLTLAVELVLFGFGAWMYARTTRARDRIGSLSFAGLLLALLIIYMSSVFGPPPPSPEAIAYTGLALWLLVAWAYWIDRHRTVDSHQAFAGSAHA